jgi:hypothetical protein
MRPDLPPLTKARRGEGRNGQGEIARFYDGALLDFAYGRHGNLGSACKLLLAHPCLETSVAEPLGEPTRLLSVEAIGAPSPSGASHLVILAINIYR